MCCERWMAYVSCTVWQVLELGREMRRTIWFILQRELPAPGNEHVALNLCLGFDWKCVSLTPISIRLLSTPFVSWKRQQGRRGDSGLPSISGTHTHTLTKWTMPAARSLWITWPAFHLSSPPLTSLSDVQETLPWLSLLPMWRCFGLRK